MTFNKIFLPLAFVFMTFASEAFAAKRLFKILDEPTDDISECNHLNGIGCDKIKVRLNVVESLEDVKIPKAKCQLQNKGIIDSDEEEGFVTYKFEVGFIHKHHIN